MADDEDIRTIIEQERALAFPRFDEDVAFRLGSMMRERALERAMPVVIDIRTWERQLFFAALPGSNGSNENWVRRKANTVKLYARSTYRMVLEQKRPDRNFHPDHGLDPADYVLAGGGFPVRLENAGVVGAIIVSGLPQRDDHGFAVEALNAFLGRDAPLLATID